MLKIKKIAVTGGLAAGKTTVCNIFKELGSYVAGADEIVHQLLSPETDTGQQVASLIGLSDIDRNTFGRKKIADVVFSQPNLLTALEKILHPAVFNEIERLYAKACQEKEYPLFLAEIPLLYEAGGEDRFDVVISVYASDELCKKRFTEKTEYPSTEFDKRMNRQIPPQQKAHRSHYTIENSGTLEELKTQVKDLYFQLTKH